MDENCTIEGCERAIRARRYCAAHYMRWYRGGGREHQHSEPECSIEDCERRAHARGWCSVHYGRWRGHGDPLSPVAHYADTGEAFSVRTEWHGDCLVWVGSINASGYGQIKVEGRLVKAHRYAWERVNGPIADGMVIDHVCWNRACVNVDHLRLATPQQNRWNLSGAMKDRKHDLPRGVYHSREGYLAHVRAEGVRHYLGTYATPEEASAVAEAKRKELFGEFAGRA